ncbi:Zeta toxin [compost metagenome]
MRAVLLVGLPGCGKSTLAAAIPGMVEINRDGIRERLFGSRRHHAHEGAVSREHARLIRLHAARGDDLVISDTLTQRRSRRDLIRVLKELGYRVEVWVFDVGEATCQARNRARSEPVPVEVIGRMSRRLRGSPPSMEEGMDALRLIRQDGAEPLLSPADSVRAGCESLHPAGASTGRARARRPSSRGGSGPNREAECFPGDRAPG